MSSFPTSFSFPRISRFVSCPQELTLSKATGHVGSHIVGELLKRGRHEVTAITHHGGTSKFPEGVKVAPVDYSKEDTIIETLRGHDFLIIILSNTTGPEVHPNICNSAVKAGIRWMMPNAYGMDPNNERLLNENVYGPVARKAFKDVKSVGGYYINPVCNFWYEYSLVAGLDLYGFDLKNKKAIFFDDGTEKINAATLAQCGRAVAALLDLPIKKDGDGPALENWKDNGLYVSSFLVSQRDMLDSIHRAMGDSDADWSITSEPAEAAEERVAKALEELQQGSFAGFAKAMYTRFFYKTGDGNYEAYHGLNSDKLGLSKEDLDKVTKFAVKKQLKEGRVYERQ
ncbi:NAD(P)-binding protein [Bimuria novae-zelandiae CBS 107.79]|uniref:NAD(P)-binding protein n=1 Tax=Bimuria novae-zelandiae CBS 107.79 TaxID=1447943 RepID=A0A6A5UQ52_9PLEO|nr:NAD(P)-binding protein [Bimuria novae-zelandiae CBS 107.79]